jgi:hypothetical protein
MVDMGKILNGKIWAGAYLNPEMNAALERVEEFTGTRASALRQALDRGLRQLDSDYLEKRRESV